MAFKKTITDNSTSDTEISAPEAEPALPAGAQTEQAQRERSLKEIKDEGHEMNLPTSLRGTTESTQQQEIEEKRNGEKQNKKEKIQIQQQSQECQQQPQECQQQPQESQQKRKLRNSQQENLNLQKRQQGAQPRQYQREKPNSQQQQHQTDQKPLHQACQQQKEHHRTRIMCAFRSVPNNTTTESCACVWLVDEETGPEELENLTDNVGSSLLTGTTKRKEAKIKHGLGNSIHRMLFSNNSNLNRTGRGETAQKHYTVTVVDDDNLELGNRQTVLVDSERVLKEIDIVAVSAALFGLSKGPADEVVGMRYFQLLYATDLSIDCSRSESRDNAAALVASFLSETKVDARLLSRFVSGAFGSTEEGSIFLKQHNGTEKLKSLTLFLQPVAGTPLKERGLKRQNDTTSFGTENMRKYHYALNGSEIKVGEVIKDKGKGKIVEPSQFFKVRSDFADEVLVFTEMVEILGFESNTDMVKEGLDKLFQDEQFCVRSLRIKVEESMKVMDDENQFVTDRITVLAKHAKEQHDGVEAILQDVKYKMSLTCKTFYPSNGGSQVDWSSDYSNELMMSPVYRK